MAKDSGVASLLVNSWCHHAARCGFKFGESEPVNRAHSERLHIGNSKWVIYTYHITYDQLSIWMHIWFHSFTAQCHLNLHFSCVLVELDHFTASTTLSDSQKTRLVALSVGRATEFRPFLEEIPSKLPYFGLPSSFPALCLGKV